MKKLGVFGAVLILIMMLSTVSSAWAWTISLSWTKVKPYADKTYDAEIGNSAVGDWGGISIGAEIVKYVDWGSGVNYDTLLVRIAVDVALKDDYRDRTFWPFYLVRWVKLEFLETLNPDFTAIESHDLSAYNLKVEEDVNYPEAEAAITTAMTLIEVTHPALGMLLLPIEIVQALGKVVPTEETKDDAERYDEGAQIVWLNPDLPASYESGWWADWSIDEATGYCELYWQVYDGTSYHKIQFNATVSFSRISTLYEVLEDVETSVTLKFTGGGGGCPILSVYDGTEYVEEGLLDIHNVDGVDEVATRTLTVTPEPVEHRYLMCLTEHHQTHSHVDQVQLYATLTDGKIIRLPLVSAVHSEDGNVLQELLFSDDVRADTLGADHNNGTSEYINLEFTAPEGLEIQEFRFWIEGHNIISKK